MLFGKNLYGITPFFGFIAFLITTVFIFAGRVLRHPSLIPLPLPLP
jgi:hypothetical protein